MKSKKNLPIKFTCSKCYKEQYFPYYVFAHWQDDLRHLCECGANHSIIRGKVAFLKMSRKRK